ncbi:PREDICTED: cold-inducible RNA-binding protein-like [Nelumbo nucifera]|uniref:Cold-inducible RNA-binding protein-like n=1 Tax=Nelumbo nucifera TaxID=4432 RepID=A0A1U8AD33_NELNU|nr:PREDICTED: cold-inducible RNA-binding protein-like [Nelumbo nucifera]
MMASLLVKNMIPTPWFQCFNVSSRKFSSQLFVSRLSSYTTDKELKKLFSSFGIVKEARLVKDPRTQRPKGFGFVTYESENEAQKALKAMNGRMVDGRLIFVEVAKTSTHKEKKATS